MNIVIKSAIGPRVSPLITVFAGPFFLSKPSHSGIPMAKFKQAFLNSRLSLKPMTKNRADAGAEPLSTLKSKVVNVERVSLFL